MKNNSQGFTIVELVVAIIVGSIITSAAMLILISHTRLSQRGRDLIIANAYAERKVESLRSLGFSGLGLGTTNITSELPTELNTPRSGSVEVSSQSSAVKKVVLTITYNDQGASRTYSYTTYVGELGVGQY